MYENNLMTNTIKYNVENPEDMPDFEVDWDKVYENRIVM